MNIAALVSGPITDMFRMLFENGVTVFGWHLSPLRALFMTGVITSFLQSAVAGFGMREVSVGASGEVGAHALGWVLRFGLFFFFSVLARPQLVHGLFRNRLKRFSQSGSLPPSS